MMLILNRNVCPNSNNVKPRGGSCGRLVLARLGRVFTRKLLQAILREGGRPCVQRSSRSVASLFNSRLQASLSHCFKALQVYKLRHHALGMRQLCQPTLWVLDSVRTELSTVSSILEAKTLENIEEITLSSPWVHRIVNNQGERTMVPTGEIIVSPGLQTIVYK